MNGDSISRFLGIRMTDFRQLKKIPRAQLSITDRTVLPTLPARNFFSLAERKNAESRDFGDMTVSEGDMIEVWGEMAEVIGFEGGAIVVKMGDGRTDFTTIQDLYSQMATAAAQSRIRLEQTFTSSEWVRVTNVFTGESKYVKPRNATITAVTEFDMPPITAKREAGSPEMDFQEEDTEEPENFQEDPGGGQPAMEEPEPGGFSEDPGGMPEGAPDFGQPEMAPPVPEEPPEPEIDQEAMELVEDYHEHGETRLGESQDPTFDAVNDQSEERWIEHEDPTTSSRAGFTHGPQECLYCGNTWTGYEDEDCPKCGTVAEERTSHEADPGRTSSRTAASQPQPGDHVTNNSGMYEDYIGDVQEVLGQTQSGWWVKLDRGRSPTLYSHVSGKDEDGYWVFTFEMDERDYENGLPENWQTDDFGSTASRTRLAYNVGERVRVKTDNGWKTTVVLSADPDGTYTIDDPAEWSGGYGRRVMEDELRPDATGEVPEEVYRLIGTKQASQPQEGDKIWHSRELWVLVSSLMENSGDGEYLVMDEHGVPTYIKQREAGGWESSYVDTYDKTLRQRAGSSPWNQNPFEPPIRNEYEGVADEEAMKRFDPKQPIQTKEDDFQIDWPVKGASINRQSDIPAGTYVSDRLGREYEITENDGTLWVMLSPIDDGDAIRTTFELMKGKYDIIDLSGGGFPTDWEAQSYAHPHQEILGPSQFAGRKTGYALTQANALDGDMTLEVDGEEIDPEDLTGWAMYEKTEPTKMVQMDEGFSVETLEGPMDADAGDFMAEGPEGELYPVDEDIQGQTYEQASE